MFLKKIRSQQKPLFFVLLLGFVSLLADITYEGARSISGQYLSLLGAGAVAVSVISGFGEMMGYALRLFSGYISDKSKRYWLITIIGYVINLFAVPALAFARSWEAAAFLLIAERCGKAIRSPSRDAMLSYATKELGRGWGFGIHSAMDQTGAILGPLIILTIFFLTGSYPYSLAILFIPAFVALIVLFIARHLYPEPQKLEIEKPLLEPQRLNKSYWYYVVGISLVAFGYVDFPLIAFHFQRDSFSELMIPIFYSLAMAAAGLSALVFGRLYDRYGLPVLIVSILSSAFFAPLVFFGGFYASLIGTVLWGIGIGAQKSLMRAIIATLVSVKIRGTAYGMMNTCFGIAWFVGSICIGLLYETSLVVLSIFSVAAQIASIPFILSLRTESRR